MARFIHRDDNANSAWLGGSEVANCGTVEQYERLRFKQSGPRTASLSELWENAKSYQTILRTDDPFDGPGGFKG